MKKRIIAIGIGVLALSSCALIKESKPTDEKFMFGTTLNDGRVVHSTFDVRYNNEFLSKLLTDNKINIDEFLSKLENVSTLNDGGSKLYKYTEALKFSGISEYYVLACNSLDGIKDIYIAKNQEKLNDLCNLKIDDLELVSMKVKEGTLSSKGLTVVITDTSDRKNIYGTDFRVDKYTNGKWVQLTSKIEMAFTSMAIYPDDEQKIEQDISWLSYYGRLSSGKYRLVKKTSIEGEGTVHYLTTEFNIK